MSSASRALEQARAKLSRSNEAREASASNSDAKDSVHSQQHSMSKPPPKPTNSKIHSDDKGQKDLISGEMKVHRVTRRSHRRSHSSPSGNPLQVSSHGPIEPAPLTIETSQLQHSLSLQALVDQKLPNTPGTPSTASLSSRATSPLSPSSPPSIDTDLSMLAKQKSSRRRRATADKQSESGRGHKSTTSAAHVATACESPTRTAASSSDASNDLKSPRDRKREIEARMHARRRLPPANLIPSSSLSSGNSASTAPPARVPAHSSATTLANLERLATSPDGTKKETKLSPKMTIRGATTVEHRTRTAPAPPRHRRISLTTDQAQNDLSGHGRVFHMDLEPRREVPDTSETELDKKRSRARRGRRPRNSTSGLPDIGRVRSQETSLNDLSGQAERETSPNRLPNSADEQNFVPNPEQNRNDMEGLGVNTSHMLSTTPGAFSLRPVTRISSIDSFGTDEVESLRTGRSLNLERKKSLDPMEVGGVNPPPASVPENEVLLATGTPIAAQIVVESGDGVSEMTSSSEEIISRIRQEMDARFQSLTAATSAVTTATPVQAELVLSGTLEGSESRSENMQDPKVSEAAKAGTSWRKRICPAISFLSVLVFLAAVGFSLWFFLFKTSDDGATSSRLVSPSQPNPTEIPSSLPTVSPTFILSSLPTYMNFTSPIDETAFPSTLPGMSQPSVEPSIYPSFAPQEEGATIPPEDAETQPPTQTITKAPSPRPSLRPSIQLTTEPTRRPSLRPTRRPTTAPTRGPTPRPSPLPTTAAPDPTDSPSIRPATGRPTRRPTPRPTTEQPTDDPTWEPTEEPTAADTFAVTDDPTEEVTEVSSGGVDAELFTLFFAISGSALQNTNSPQYEALEFLSQNYDLLGTTAGATIIETYVAATIWYSTGGNRWSQDPFFRSSDVCSWNNGNIGIFCSSGSINEIFLEENNLVGSWPVNEVGELDGLVSLSLGGNEEFLAGDLGGFFDSLPSGLRNLDCASCSMSGSLNGVSWSRFGSIITLDLSNTGISGAIPNALGSLPSLQILELSNNSLRGTVPTFSGDRLSSLSVGNNGLTGNFANLLAAVPSSTMRILRAGGNSLTGVIPNQIGSYSKIFFLDLSNNRIGGSLPDGLGSLTDLQGLILESNQLQGSVPDVVASSLPSLSQLRLHDNFFEDDLTAPFCSFTIGASTTADCGVPALVVCPCCLCYSKDLGGFFLRP